MFVSQEEFGNIFMCEKNKSITLKTVKEEENGTSDE